MFLRFIAASLAFLTFAYADTLILKSGSTIQGNYAGGDTRHVKIVVGDHVETYTLDEVSRLEFGSGASRTYSATPPPLPPPSPEPATRTERRYSETPPP